MKKRIAGIAVIVNLILSAGKILIGFISNSAAILAEGLHSGVDVFSSAIGYIGIKTSEKPADKKHPYGHHKFEILSGLIITLILFGTGIGIIYEAYSRFIQPIRISSTYLALGVMLSSAVINGIMAKVKIYFGKKENSLSLLSDGSHSKIDAITSIAVFAGVILAKYWIYADPLIALFIGIYIIRESFSLGREATDSLLDVSAGKEIEDKIIQTAKKNNIKVSDLKTQKRGAVITANINIKLPKNLSVNDATKISNKLRNSLLQNIKGLEYVAIQIESHDLMTGFYKPQFQKGFGWKRKERFKDKIIEAEGKGPEGFCVCPKCNYKTKHKRGIPCASLKCPKCNIPLSRT